MEEEKKKAEPPQTFNDQLRRWVHPVLDPIVTILAGWGLSPNGLTIVGTLGHILSAWLLATGQITYAGFSLLVIAPLDVFDGALARKLALDQGGFGAFLDSTFDRFAEIVLFGGFIYYYHQVGDVDLILLAYAAMGGSLMVSYTRARAEGLGFDCKVGLLGRFERYVLLIIFLILNLPVLCLIILVIFTYMTAGQRIIHVWRKARERVAGGA